MSHESSFVPIDTSISTGNAGGLGISGHQQRTADPLNVDAPVRNALDEILRRNEPPASEPANPNAYFADHYRAIFERGSASSAFTTMYLMQLNTQEPSGKQSYWSRHLLEWARVQPQRPALTLDIELLEDVVRRIVWSPDCDGAGHPKPEVVMKVLEISDRTRAAAVPLVATTEDGFVILEWQFDNGASVEFYIEDDAPFPGEAALCNSDDDRDVPVESVSALAALLKSCASRSELSAR